MTPKEVLALIREKEVKAVDLRFMDFPGLWQHFTIPAEALAESTFEEGLGFDGSSIRGWHAINESDMLVLPQPETAFIDPFFKEATLTLICNIQDPLTKEDYSRDPRNVARKAVNYMKSTGIADIAYFGPELEFFVFDSVRYDQTQNAGYYFIDSVEGAWNTGREEKPNLGYKLRYKEGYFPVPPSDALHDLRTEMMLTMIAVRPQDRGAAPRGRHRRTGRDRHALRPAGGDGRQRTQVQVRRQERRQEVRQDGDVHAQAAVHGQRLRHARTHVALEERRQPVCRLGLRRPVGHGHVRHRRPACGTPRPCARITNPTTNSYKRLVPGYEAPVNLAYSRRNRSASIRIPVYSPSPKAKRIEFRCPDGSSNPYLAFAAMLMAMLDGIKNKIKPGEPLDKDIYDLEPEELAKVPKTPGSLEEALAMLEKDHEFLLQGDVFTTRRDQHLDLVQAREGGRGDPAAAASV